MSAYLTAKQFAIANKVEAGKKLIKDLPHITQEQAETRFEDEVLKGQSGIHTSPVATAPEQKGAVAPEQRKTAPKKDDNAPSAPKKLEQAPVGGGMDLPTVKKVFDIIMPIAKEQGWIK